MAINVGVRRREETEGSLSANWRAPLPRCRSSRSTIRLMGGLKEGREGGKGGEGIIE